MTLQYEQIVTNTKAGFQAAGQRMDTIENVLTDTQKSLQMVMTEIQKQNKRLLSTPVSGQSFDRVWQTENEAKEFGDIILQCMGKKAMSSENLSEGGVLLPEQLSNRLIELIAKYGKYRANAMVIPVNSGETSLPKVNSDLIVYCPSLGSAITESDMDFGQVKLLPQFWACLTLINRTVIEDSILGVAEIVGRSMARAIAKQEDLCGFGGDGTLSYFNIIGIAEALKAVDPTIGNIAGLQVASGNAYSEITLGDFQGVAGRLPSDYDEDAKWYMNKKFYFSVIWPLVETAGVASIFELLSDKKARHFLGYPVEFVPGMPSTEANSQVCAILGDLKMGSYLGQRRGITIDRSDDVRFTNFQTAVLGHERISINNFGVGDTTDAGPIVGLITAAS